MPDSLFEQETDLSQQQTDDNIAKVIAAKGDTWSDPNVMAKGYLSSQEHIMTLEAENAQLKEGASKNDYMKEVLDRIEAGKAKPTDGEPATKLQVSTETADNQSVTVEQIKGLVTEALTENEATNTANQNLVETKAQLTKAFGTEAQAKINARTTELGMTKERMDQLASESPTAFMSLMGEAPVKQQNTQLESALNSTDALTQPSQRNWAYYQKMRKENPTVYRTPKLQAQMMEDYASMGEGFGLT
jgi:hypothetical protein